jgi:hypothetical protein
LLIKCCGLPLFVPHWLNYMKDLFTRVDIPITRVTSLNFLILFVCVGYLISEVYYLVTLLPTNRADFTVYHQTSLKVLSGQVPFRDFRLEYPVFSLIPLLLPGVVNLLFHSSFKSYCVLFTLQNVLYLAMSAWVISKIKFSENNPGENVLSFTLFCLFFIPILLFRYDSFPVFLSICMIWAMPHRPTLTGVFLALAIGAKLYPVIFAPVIFFYYFCNQDYRKLSAFVIGGLSVLLATLVISLPFTGLSFFDFLKYHGQRGIQLESVTSGIILLLNQLGLADVTLINNFGSYNIETPASSAILQFITIATPITFGLLLCMIVWVFLAEKRTAGKISIDSAIYAFTLLLLAFLMLNKVMSPQYMIWLFPVVPYLGKVTRIKFVITLMLTITIYPGWYNDLTLFKLVPVIMLNARNLLILLMTAEVFMLVLRKGLAHRPVGTNP